MSPSPALSGWLPILSPFQGYLVVTTVSLVEPACGLGAWCFMLRTSSLRLFRSVPTDACCRAHRYGSRPWGQAMRADLASASGMEYNQLAQDGPWASTLSGSGCKLGRPDHLGRVGSPGWRIGSPLCPPGIGLWQHPNSGASPPFVHPLPTGRQVSHR